MTFSKILKCHQTAYRTKPHVPICLIEVRDFFPIARIQTKISKVTQHSVWLWTHLLSCSHRMGCTCPDPTNFWESNMGTTPKIVERSTYSLQLGLYHLFNPGGAPAVSVNSKLSVLGKIWGSELYALFFVCVWGFPGRGSWHSEKGWNPPQEIAGINTGPWSCHVTITFNYC